MRNMLDLLYEIFYTGKISLRVDVQTPFQKRQGKTATCLEGMNQIVENVEKHDI